MDQQNHSTIAPSTRRKYAGTLLSPVQVATILNVHHGTIKKWISSGALSAIILPKKPGQTRNEYRIKGEEVDQILENFQSNSNSLQSD